MPKTMSRHPDEQHGKFVVFPTDWQDKPAGKLYADTVEDAKKKVEAHNRAPIFAMYYTKTRGDEVGRLAGWYRRDTTRSGNYRKISEGQARLWSEQLRRRVQAQAIFKERQAQRANVG